MRRGNWGVRGCPSSWCGGPPVRLCGGGGGVCVRFVFFVCLSVKSF